MRPIVFLCLLIPLAVAGQTVSTVTLAPNAIATTAGAEFSVQVLFVPAEMEQPPVLGCLDVSIGYDPKAVQFLSARFPQPETPLNDNERRPETLTSVHANNSGHVRLQRLSLGDAATERKLAAGGSTPAAVLQFRARTEGVVPLLLNVTTACDASSNPIEVQAIGAFAIVAAPAR